MRSSLLVALLIATIVPKPLPASAIEDSAAANQTSATPTHVLRVKRDRENRAVHLVEINATVTRDFASFRQQLDQIPAGAVLSWKTPFLTERIVFDDCYLEVAELTALCRERGLICDFEFGCRLF